MFLTMKHVVNSLCCKNFQLGPDTCISHTQTPLPRVLRIYPGPLGDASLTDEALSVQGGHWAGNATRPPHCPETCGILESERRERDPFLKQRKTPPENRANDALIQGTQARVFTGSEACLYSSPSALASQELNHRE